MPAAASAGPRLSIVIPAHDEAQTLPETLGGLHASLAGIGRDHEVIVVDNDCTDATAEMALRHGARVVTEPHRQISRARNTGARHAVGGYLIFLDADTRPPAALLERALAELDGGACGGGALVAFDHVPSRFYRDGIAAWNAVAKRRRWAAGCFLFTRRDSFAAVGGFDERLYAGDEVTLSRALRRWGRAHGHRFVVIEHPPVITSARKAHWFTPAQHVLVLLLALFPPALRSRRLMWFWYRRPNAER